MKKVLKSITSFHTRFAQKPIMLVIVVAFALCMDYLVYGLIIPLTPHSPAGVVDEHQMGLLFGAYGLGVLLATPIFGVVGDKFGCRKPFIFGVFTLVIATFLFCFGTTFNMLLAARILQGVSAAASWTTGMALVAEHCVEKRVEMLGFAMIGSTAGSIIGPTLGGWLFQLGGYYLPFFVVGILIGIDALMRITLLPPDRPRAKVSADAKSSATKSNDVRKLLFNRSVILAAVAVALAASGWGLIEPLLPSNLTLVAHSTPAMIGLMFTASTIAYGIITPFVAKFADKVDVKTAVAVGMILMAITLPLLAMFTYSIVLTGLALCLVSMSYAFLLNPTSAELGNAVDRLQLNCYATAYAVYNIAYSVGMIGSDFFAAEIAPHLTNFQSMLCMSAVYVLCVPFVIMKRKAEAVALQPEMEPACEGLMSPPVMA